MTEAQAVRLRAPARRLRLAALNPPQVYIPAPGDLVRASHGNGLVHRIQTVGCDGRLLLACGADRQLSDLRPMTAAAPFHECDRCLTMRDTPSAMD